jgi:large subunit ribosomal protein L13
MKTYVAGPASEIEWYVVDASGKVLGRLATQIAMLLRGKHRPTFTPHADMGHRVAVINAEKIRVTGKKETQKTYFSYSGYPGGAKFRTFREQMRKKPEEIIRHAVKGMLPKNRLGDKLVKKLKIYVGPNHPHQAQRPKVLEF